MLFRSSISSSSRYVVYVFAIYVNIIPKGGTFIILYVQKVYFLYAWTGPKKCRGRSKMFKVHARKPEDKVMIKVNKRGQPIGDRKIRAEFSNFLGTVVKDHVSITYVNWHVVPEALKKKMLEYALVTPITLLIFTNSHIKMD